MQAIKIMAKSGEGVEQAAKAMAGTGEGHAMASSVDARLALRAEAMVEADALADLDVEERLREDEEADDAPKTSSESQVAAEATGASKKGQPQHAKNQT